MRANVRVGVVIPALNERESIGRVIAHVPPWVDDIVVADNGSTDGTAAIARAQGARVVTEPERGYGAACVAGIRALTDSDIVVFLDGDFSDHPEQMMMLVDPIVRGDADLVVGSRVRGDREPGALNPVQRAGNALACTLIALFWRVKFTDLGPFRAIRQSALVRLGLRDRDFGWTVEMQVKAIRYRLRVLEVATNYRPRIGRSKISGTVTGAVRAGTKIIFVIFANAFASLASLKVAQPRD